MQMWRIAATSFGRSQQSVFCVFDPPLLVKNIAVTNDNSCKYLAYSASKNEHENVPVWNQFVDAEPHRLFFALTCWLPRQHCTLETNLSQTQPLIVFESMKVGEEPFVPKPWTLWCRAAHSEKSRALEVLWWTELPFHKLNHHLCNCCHRNAHKFVFPLTDSDPSSRDKLSYAWLSWSCLLFFLELLQRRPNSLSSTSRSQLFSWITKRNTFYVCQKLSLSLKKPPRPASEHNWGQLLLGGALGPVFV